MTRAEEMRRYEDKKGIGKRVPDPETAKGGKGDGMKTAMKGEGKPGDKSKLTKMAAAEKKVR